jgi:hypothetical protein
VGHHMQLARYYRFKDFWGLIIDRIMEVRMKHTFAFVIGCAALVSGALPACAAGLGWKVLNRAVRTTTAQPVPALGKAKSSVHSVLFRAAFSRESS